MNSVLSLLSSSAVLQVRLKAQTGVTCLFFWPQQYRGRVSLRGVSFLPRQQIQHQADAEGLRDAGSSQAAEQHCSDGVVGQQIGALKMDLFCREGKHVQVWLAW